jgi:hypothetical protein
VPSVDIGRSLSNAYLYISQYISLIDTGRICSEMLPIKVSLTPKTK